MKRYSDPDMALQCYIDSLLSVQTVLPQAADNLKEISGDNDLSPSKQKKTNAFLKHFSFAQTSKKSLRKKSLEKKQDKKDGEKQSYETISAVDNSLSQSETDTSAQHPVKPVDLSQKTIENCQVDLAELLKFEILGMPFYLNSSSVEVVYKVNVADLKMSSTALAANDESPPWLLEDTQADFTEIWACNSKRSNSNVVLVDTAKLLLPERYNINILSKYKIILKLLDCDWSLLVEDWSQNQSIDKEDVRWNKNSTRREWLAGSVKGGRGMLIDSDALIRCLLADTVLLS